MRSEELECSKHPLQGHQPWQQTALFTHLPAEVNTILLGVLCFLGLWCLTSRGLSSPDAPLLEGETQAGLRPMVSASRGGRRHGCTEMGH